MNVCMYIYFYSKSSVLKIMFFTFFSLTISLFGCKHLYYFLRLLVFLYIDES